MGNWARKQLPARAAGDGWGMTGPCSHPIPSLFPERTAGGGSSRAGSGCAHPEMQIFALSSFPHRNYTRDYQNLTSQRLNLGSELFRVREGWSSRIQIYGRQKIF